MAHFKAFFAADEDEPKCFRFELGLLSANSPEPVRASAGLTLGSTQQSYATESTSAVDALDRLGSLVERGVITPEEFARKKTALLNHV